MLNRSKLLLELEAISDKLFIDSSDQYHLACRVWQEICQDSVFQETIKTLPAAYALPTWVEPLGGQFSVGSIDEYAVVSVDGSQIYPDRHQNAACYLINTGIIQLNYGLVSTVSCDSIPKICLINDENNDLGVSTDLVNCQREEYEFNYGLDHGRMLKKTAPGVKQVVLFDGSLIFWHLQEKDEAVQKKFLSRYLETFERFYQEDIAMASYVSFPKTRELVQLIRTKLANFGSPHATAAKAVDGIVDAQVAGFYLQPRERTTLFQSHVPITTHYPDHLKPYFFYLHVGQEIGRVEIPAFVAQDEKKLANVSEIILDQAIKGYGYPVCLAEAHEQAVIKGPDREFFYYLLQKAGIEQKQRRIISQKSLKKRGMGI